MMRFKMAKKICNYLGLNEFVEMKQRYYNARISRKKGAGLETTVK